MPKYVLIDDNHGEDRVFETLDEVRNELLEMAEGDGDNFRANNCELFEIGEEISIYVEDRSYSVVIGGESEIPTPLPGESKADYVKRLIG